MLEIEGMLGITITMPQTCHFCGKPVIKKNGREADSLLFHSLDLNHDNWAPENKTPSHKGCHAKFHQTGRVYTEEAKRRMSDSHTGVPLSPERCKNMGLAKTGEKHPFFGKHHTEESNRKNRDSNKKFWTNLTPKQKAEHGRKSWEGRRKVKETKSEMKVRI